MTPTSPQIQRIIEEKKCIRKKKECHLLEECYVEVCHVLFAVEIIELEGGPVGLVIKYRDKTVYLPPIVTSEKITLPLKYKEFFDSTVVPEVKFKRWG